MTRLGGGMAGLALVARCGPSPPPTAPARVYRVGLLFPGSTLTAAEFWARLAELGYVEGHNLVREERRMSGDLASVDDPAAELARLPVDVIVAVGTGGTRPAANATASIPIVMMGGVGDPVGAGFVESMARPGRNVTGIVGSPVDVDLKRLELLVEAAPHVSRVAIFGPGQGIPGGGGPGSQARSVAASLGVELVGVPVTLDTPPKEYEDAFQRLHAEGVDAVLFRPGGSANAYHPLIISLAERYRMAAASPFRAFATSGGLMAYVAVESEIQRRAADYVDRILRGAKPADLPVEVAGGYDLIVNMRAARALGLTLSPTFLAQVTELIDS